MIDLARILSARLQSKVAPGCWHAFRELSDVFLDLVSPTLSPAPCVHTDPLLSSDLVFLSTCPISFITLKP